MQFPKKAVTSIAIAATCLTAILAYYNNHPTMPTYGWRVATDTTSGISFNYPESLPTNYIHAEAWPPTITVTDGVPTCTEKKTINSKAYCVTAESEGAAGSTYTTYSYATEKLGKTITLSFILRAVQCMNYDNPQQAECLKERATFDIDALADRILQSAQL